MVDLEFEAIWKQLEDEMQRTGSGLAEMGKTEDELKAEYRDIAERRVRLGLILSDIGTKNEVKVENEELHQAVVREAMRFRGQERKVFEFFKNNPAALEQLRAPIFEDKVCDFIFAKAQVTEQPVSVEELMKDPDEEEEAKPAAAETVASETAAAS
jgi:trigger factor